MSRSLTANQQAVIDSDQFEYVDTVEVRLPWSNDPVPIVIRAGSSGISIPSSFDFVEFTYQAFTAAFGRVPTTTEEDDWTGDLQTAFNTSQAALLTEADTKIDSLFTAAEYTARGRTDEQFVQDLYLAFLGRVADPIGKTFWVTQVVANGRDDVRNEFGISAEFAARVAGLNQSATFEADLREMGSVKLSDGRAQDGCEFGLQNTDNTYSVKIAEATRRLHPAPAIVKRAFKLTDGTYEPDTLLTGFARFNSADGQKASVTVRSDTSRTELNVILPVTQRCRHVYKGPGCDSPDPSATCSRIFDDATNGCASKDPAPQITDGSVTNNQPSFGGVPPFAPTSSTPTSGLPPAPELPPNGWPPDYDPDDPRLRNNWRSAPSLGSGGIF